MSVKVPGIDVSNHQGEVDWNFVVESGIQFAFIKATEGGTYQDKYYAQNATNAKNAGLMFGPYHFFRPKGPVKAQVENFLRVVGTASSFDLPPVVDLELPNEWGHFSVADRVKLVQEFLLAVKTETRRIPIIYMSASFSKDVLGEEPSLSEYPLWVAHYTRAADPWVPSPWKHWSFWQHSDKGAVNSISGNVDLNWFNGTLAQLRLLSL